MKGTSFKLSILLHLNCTVSNWTWQNANASWQISTNWRKPWYGELTITSRSFSSAGEERTRSDAWASLIAPWKFPRKNSFLMLKRSSAIATGVAVEKNKASCPKCSHRQDKFRWVDMPRCRPVFRDMFKKNPNLRCTHRKYLWCLIAWFSCSATDNSMFAGKSNNLESSASLPTRTTEGIALLR